MNDSSFYPIGRPGIPWNDDEKAAWLASVKRRRCYREDVLSPIDGLRGTYEVVEYGRLDHDPETYPLVAVRTREWRAGLPGVLVTGGVHGYETSGVCGALRFLRDEAPAFAGKINVIVVPCVSPWGYEHIHRWNPHAVDPNRSFCDPSPAQESRSLMEFVRGLGEHGIVAHIDLHETTDSDESEFRPALAARDGETFVPGTIPDGFYLVDDSENPQPEFQNAIIDAVGRVTQIAPADDNGEIIGSPVVAPGVIRYPAEKTGLCTSLTGARYTTTTEVYPDSPRATSEQCNTAQVAAVCAAIEFTLEHA